MPTRAVQQILDGVQQPEQYSKTVTQNQNQIKTTTAQNRSRDAHRIRVLATQAWDPALVQTGECGCTYPQPGWREQGALGVADCQPRLKSAPRSVINPQGSREEYDGLPVASSGLLVQVCGFTHWHTCVPTPPPT